MYFTSACTKILVRCIIMSKSEKRINTILIILGVIIIIIGMYFIYLSFNASHTSLHGGVSYASTSIEFGADFYTTSAQYTGLAANTLVDLYSLLAKIAGSFFIFCGGIDILLVLLSNCKEKKRLNDSIQQTSDSPRIFETSD